MNPRLKKLLAQFPAEKIDGLLVSKPANVSYLAGLDSSDSWLLVTAKRCSYITDFRYVEQVKKELKGVALEQYKKSIFKTVAQLCRSLRVKRLGFDSQALYYSEYQKLKKAAARIALKPTVNLVENLRQIKEPQELLKIRRAIALTDQAFDFLKKAIKPGKREKDIAAALEDFVIARGGKMAFVPIIAAGGNSVFPHARISAQKLAKNDAVTVDIGVDLDGYKSDLTRVFFLGKIPLFYRRIYAIILEAQARAIAGILPGQPANKIDGLARNFIKQKGLGKFFGHSTGHGVGLEVHERPRISAREKTVVEPGMVFTIEPGIYLPGKFGMRVEDMVLVKEKGCEVLSGFIHKSN
jgi:Xaa-Pro aminopeptidase